MSKMMIFTFLAFLNAAYYGVGNYSWFADSCLYPSPDDVRGGGPGRSSRLFTSLLGSRKRFMIERAVRGSHYPVMYVEAVFHWMECTVRERNPHLTYFGYSLVEKQLLDYSVHENFPARLALLCPGHDRVVSTVKESVLSEAVQRDIRTGARPLVGNMLENFENKSTSWAAAWSVGRLPSSDILCYGSRCGQSPHSHPSVNCELSAEAYG